MEVCLPDWLLGLLAVGAVGTGVLRQIAQIRSQEDSGSDER